jgi:hypothetical protein
MESLREWRVAPSASCSQSPLQSSLNRKGYKVFIIEHPLPPALLQSDLGLLSGRVRTGPLDEMVIEMQFSRCRMVAVEADDARSKVLLTGVTIEMEDLRCRGLNPNAAIEFTDGRCHWVGIEMEDPRCRNIRNW